MKYVKLLDFLDFLNARTKADFEGKIIDDFLKAHSIERGQFLPFIYFREDTYGRNLIFKTELYELLLLTWLPRQRTKIHDHNNQRCWMLVDSGTLTFKNYRCPDETGGELVPLGSPETCSAGGIVYIDDGEGVHCIANATNKPAVSVHLYAGPIPRCRRYDEATKEFKWEELEYFRKFDGELDKSVLAPH